MVKLLNKDTKYAVLKSVEELKIFVFVFSLIQKK